MSDFPSTTDLETAIKRLDKVEGLFQQKFLDAVQAKTPVVTGKLRDGFHWEGNEFVNDVHYAGYVELGTSYTHPVGMVETTMVEGPDLMKAAVEEAGF